MVYRVYDSSNVFARILRGELPCTKVYEDDIVLAFHDIAPKAPIHVLVIPKGAYVSMDDFLQHAPPLMIVAYFRSIAPIVALLGIGSGGYKLVAHNGRGAGQEVFHAHMHILA